MVAIVKLLMLGDINLAGVQDAAMPFRQVASEMARADAVFANLECCLYDPAADITVTETGGRWHAGYFADPDQAGKALVSGHIAAVGVANNVNFGDAPILKSLARLDALGIAHVGAGANAAAAREPVILERGGRKIGILQRTAVYWPTGHEAGTNSPGVAAMRGNTAYQMPLHKTQPGMSQCNRPGLPPLIVTWIDPPYLASLKAEIAALKSRCDFVVASCHWGLHAEVLSYMTEWAHAAMDAGADMVFGHGPHYVLPSEVYATKPIFYGLGNFSFDRRGDGSRAGPWLGACAMLDIDEGNGLAITLRLVRRNAAGETIWASLVEESADVEPFVTQSRALGAAYTEADGMLVLDLH